MHNSIILTHSQHVHTPPLYRVLPGSQEYSNSGGSRHKEQTKSVSGTKGKGEGSLLCHLQVLGCEAQEVAIVLVLIFVGLIQ